MAEKASTSKEPRLLDADELIDEILERKGPHKYTDGLSEDNWEEELERIPLFMTKAPSSIDPATAPSLAALQDLKYQDSTAEGRALTFKEDGNEHFKLKKYREAVQEYTAGIKERAKDVELNAVLYTNRATAQFHLGNYRSSLSDAVQARKTKPNHMKAIIRGALSCSQLQRYTEAVKWCDEGISIEPENAKLRELRAKVVKENKQLERGRRKKALSDKAKLQLEQKLLDTIKSRGITLAPDDATEDPTQKLCLQGPHPSGERVHFDDADCLVWPVLFLYPEYGQTDFIASFHEDASFLDHLEVMFGQEPVPWDTERRYNLDTIEIYYETAITKQLKQVAPDANLRSVLASKDYVVVSGTPSFTVLATGTDFKNQFCRQY